MPGYVCLNDISNTNKIISYTNTLNILKFMIAHSIKYL